MEDADIKVGHNYSHRRNRSPDRFVVWRDRTRVQYDSDSVRWAAHYPTIPLERFIKWAGAEVED